MLGFFGDKLGGYAIALLLYALIFKIVFLPFSIKQQKNQIAMAKLTPKIELIKAKYRGRTDQRTMQKQQQEIMELQQKEGYNPLSGCLPLLLQLPLIMLLFTVINNPLSYIAKTTDAYDTVEKTKSEIIIDVNNLVSDENNQLAKDAKLKGQEIAIINRIYTYVNAHGEEGIEAIEELGLEYHSIPSFKLGKADLSTSPSFKNISLLVLIPFIAAGAQWVSMWVMRKFNSNPMMQNQDPQTQASTRIMDFMFPAMTLWMAFKFSAMLGLYWIYQTLLGLVQSLILAKAMPLPKYTEEELKQMRKAQKEAEKAARIAAKTQPKYRSLHYIDDDDYDTLPTAPTTNESNKEKPLDGEAPQIKD